MGLTNGKQQKDLCKRALQIADAHQVQSALMAIMEIEHHALISYTNKSDTIEGWPEPIKDGDLHFIWSLV